jgi:hypothetical protein
MANCTTVTVGIRVERFDSKYIPFEYHLFHLRQQGSDGVADWAQESVGLLGVLGGLPGEHKMHIGEVRKYWVRMRMSYWEDYWGEGNQDIEILKIRRCR